MNASKIKIVFFFFILIFSINKAFGQLKNDSVFLRADSLLQSSPKIKPVSEVDLLKGNQYLNTSPPRVSQIEKERAGDGKEFLFYLLGAIILLLAFFKAFYTKYFNTIFRVFFNTSLRQNQLTDLLLQATLPSLIFNIFFITSTGIYTWLLLVYYHGNKYSSHYIYIGVCILALSILYTGKFFALKFIGWITGLTNLTDQYIFVIFLINKIAGIVLIPFIVLLAFAPGSWINTTIIISAGGLSILFLLRYLRSYSLLQGQLKIHLFHFLLYIAAVEVVPILVLYKLIMHIS